MMLNHRESICWPAGFLFFCYSIQVQRGVGTSSTEPGHSWRLLTFPPNEFNADPYAEFNNSYGSFNTWKIHQSGIRIDRDHFTELMPACRASAVMALSTGQLPPWKSFQFPLPGWIKILPSAEHHFRHRKKLTRHGTVSWSKIKRRSCCTWQALCKQYRNTLFYCTGLIKPVPVEHRTYNYFTYRNQTDNYSRSLPVILQSPIYEELSLNAAGF